MKEILNSFEYLPMLSEFVPSVSRKDSMWFTHIILSYTEFITQPLTKGMFVPCDEDGNVLEEPLPEYVKSLFLNKDECDEYQQAKERVLFSDARYEEIEDGYLIKWKHDYIKYDNKFNCFKGSKQMFGFYTTIEDAINGGVQFKLK